jgi:hypothetical protein
VFLLPAFFFSIFFIFLSVSSCFVLDSSIYVLSILLFFLTVLLLPPSYTPSLSLSSRRNLCFMCLKGVKIFKWWSLYLCVRYSEFR